MWSFVVLIILLYTKLVFNSWRLTRLKVKQIVLTGHLLLEYMFVLVMRTPSVTVFCIEHIDDNKKFNKYTKVVGCRVYGGEAIWNSFRNVSISI